MSTSSDESTSSPLEANGLSVGEHWIEMTQTLSPEATASFADSIDQDLVELEEKLEYFASPRSVLKSLRRG